MQFIHVFRDVHLIGTIIAPIPLDYRYIRNEIQRVCGLKECELDDVTPVMVH